jgi:hypothetical protein
MKAPGEAAPLDFDVLTGATLLFEALPDLTVGATAELEPEGLGETAGNWVFFSGLERLARAPGTGAAGAVALGVQRI